MEKEIKAKIQKLVDGYHLIVRREKEHEFTEADVCTKFILPLLKALGWDTKNIDEVKEQRRTLTGPSDFLLCVNKRPKLVLEAKKFEENLDARRVIKGREESYPEQAMRYACYLKINWVILTNFKELRLYYSWEIKPEEALVFQFKCHEYLPNLEKLMILSKKKVALGALDTYEKRRVRQNIDEEVLGDLFECRKILIGNISRNNPSLTYNERKESVQKILDRILVIRVAEDKNIIGYDSLWKELDSWKTRGLPTLFIRSLKSLFRDFDDIYNSKLFEKHVCEDLQIDNEVLEKVIDTLYKYNFDLIGADVLGAIYEDYIGHVLREEGEKVEIVEEPRKRKEAGIYYTPTYIVDYIVKNTLGETLKGKTPDETRRIKVLDPACGSGSFLIKAFDLFKEYYQEILKKAAKTGKLTPYTTILADKEILTQNLYGVDLDEQAAEIASVNLMLKTLKRGEKLPLILEKNIKIGNSLISGTGEELKKYFKKPEEKKSFNWEEEFPENFKEGGFDVVIGNPPYGGKLDRAEKRFINEKFRCFGSKDTAEVFLELALKLAKKGGVISLIVPKSIAFYTTWSKIRKRILEEGTIIRLCDVGIAFKEVNYEQLILIIKKSSADKKAKAMIDRALPLKKYKHEKEIVCLGEVRQATMKMENKLIFTPISTETEKILQKIRERSVPLGSIAKEIFRGLYIANDIKKKLKPGKYKFLEKVPHVSRYHINRLWKADLSNNQWKKKIKKILRPRVFLKVLRGKRLVAHYDFGEIVTTEKLVNVILKEDSGYDIRFLTAVINSLVPSFYMEKMLFSDTTETSRVMDEDYSGSIPIPRSVTQYEQEDIAKLVDRIVDLNKQSNKMIVDFDRYLTEPILSYADFRSYYEELATDDKVALDKTSRGNIKRLKLEEEGDWLVFKVDYVTKPEKQEFDNVEVFRCRFKDELLRNFLFYAVRNYKRTLGTGNLLDRILKIKLPCFDENLDRNKQIIYRMIGEYLKAVEEKDQIEKEIQEIDNKLNRKIHKLYGLKQEETSIIESYFRGV